MIIASIYPFPFFIGHGHDVNFTLIKDGDIFSCEEGKITSTVMNQYDRFPERAMLAGFKHFGITAVDVDMWVFGNPLHTPVKEAQDIERCIVTVRFVGIRTYVRFQMHARL